MIEKFVFNEDVINLRNRLRNESIDDGKLSDGQPELEENIFSIDSISLVIGNNGSGKTRLLDAIWNAMDRWEGRGWRSDWQPILHQNSLTSTNKVGVIFFSHAPNKSKKKSSLTQKCIDASPVASKKYPPESLLGKEKILRGVTRIDPRFVGEYHANLRVVINRCIEFLFAEAIRLPEKWTDVRTMFKSIVESRSQIPIRRGAQSDDGPAAQVFGIRPELDEQLSKLAKAIYDAATEFSRPGRAAAIFAALCCETKSELADKILMFSLKRYFGFLVGDFYYYEPRPDIRRRINERIRAFEEIIHGNHGAIQMTMGPNQFSFAIRLNSHEDLRRLRESPLGDIVTLRWSNVSSGQWALVVQLIEIEKAFKKLARKSGINSILLLIDEGDAFLHLEWQRQYISILDSMLLEMKNEHASRIQYVQAIIATHSPLLASDVPSGYVNRLHNGRVVNHSFTFAAPYQSLLSISFGAKSIGAHATRIISETVSNARAGTLSSRDMYVANIVDDPIIKRELDDLLSRWQ